MSMDPQMMAQMLAGQLGGQGGQQQQGQAPQVQPLGAAAQLAQKIMLMQALQKPPQPGVPPPPQPNVMGQIAAQPQAMQGQPTPGGVNA